MRVVPMLGLLVRIHLLRRYVHRLWCIARVTCLVVSVLELRIDLLIPRTLLFRLIVSVALILGGGVVVRLFGIGITIVISTGRRRFVLGEHDTRRLIA